MGRKNVCFTNVTRAVENRKWHEKQPEKFHQDLRDPVLSANY